MERLMAAFDTARSIGSVVRLLVLLGVDGGGHRDLQLNVDLPPPFDGDGGGEWNADCEDDCRGDVQLLPAQAVDRGDDCHVERGEYRLAQVGEDRHADGSEDDLASDQVGVGLAVFVSSTQSIDIYLLKQGRTWSNDGVRS
jgi:hypothetical protein